MLPIYPTAVTALCRSSRLSSRTGRLACRDVLGGIAFTARCQPGNRWRAVHGPRLAVTAQREWWRFRLPALASCSVWLARQVRATKNNFGEAAGVEPV